MMYLIIAPLISYYYSTTTTIIRIKIPYNGLPFLDYPKKACLFYSNFLLILFYFFNSRY
jgi:hypothetical protein